MQFAKYKKEAKKYSIYKGSSANVSEVNVGMLCSWYEQSSDSPNKFEIIQKNKDSSYHQIKTFLCLLAEESLNPVVDSSEERCSQNNIILTSDKSKSYTKAFYINDECMNSITAL